MDKSKVSWSSRLGGKIKIYLSVGLVFAVVVGSFLFLDVSPLEIFSSPEEFARLGDEMWPPTFSNFDRTLALLFETLVMAFAGTLIGSLIAVPLAFAATKAIPTNPFLRLFAKGLITAARAIPALVFALILVRLLGFGPLVGAIALSFSSVGMIGRQVVDSLDTLPKVRFESGLSHGLTRSQVLIASGLPVVIPTIVSSILHRLEINLRSSAVLGFVGAGGIGILLIKDLGQLNYSGALGTTALILAVVFASESLSSRIRLGILRPPKSGLRSSWRGLEPKAFDPALRLYSFSVGAILVSGAALAFLVVSSTNSIRTFESIFSIVRKAWPPNFSDYSDLLVVGLGQTFAMAISGTSLGLLVAIPLALLGASNVTRFWLLNKASRLVMSAIRATPDLVFALFFVVAVGLGPAAGVYAMAVGTAGILGKFFSDSLEDASIEVRDAFAAHGATSLKYLVAGLIPERGGALTAALLHMVDINMRISISLGIIGVGGIGLLLNGALSVLAFDTVFAILVVLIVGVALLEKLTSRAKKLAA